MQPKFTLKKSWRYYFCSVSLFLSLLFVSSLKLNAQVTIYETTHASTTGAEITAAANGAATSMGDAIVMASTPRLINQVQVRVFTLLSAAPFDLTMRIYTDCSTSGAANSPCGNGPGTLVAGSTKTVTGITPAGIGVITTVTFTYPTPVDLTAETDNQVNVTINASRSDVYWILDETPAIGSLPPGEPAGSLVTRCGSVGTNNGCARNFGVNNNFDLKITSLIPPCSGTPNPGATASSSGFTAPNTTGVCAGSNFTLSMPGLPPASGYTYQWQSSAAATGPWTNIGAATAATLTTSLASGSLYYRCAVTCGANTGNSTPILVNTSFVYCYCSSASVFPEDEDIFNVSIGTLNNSSSCASTGPGVGSVQNIYSNYRSLTPSQIVYGNMPFSVTIGLCSATGTYTNSVAIWIDFNHNGVFDAAERVYFGTGFGAHTESGTIVIPASALAGVTGMRVVNVETGNAGGITPCGVYGWGETEDYLVDIQPCVSGTFTTVPQNATIQCSENATFSVTATGSFLNYSWQYRTSAAAPWLAVANGGVYSGAGTSTLTLTNIPQTMSGYQYRALITGPCTTDFSSPPATLTVNALQPLINPTSATICAGSVQQLSITNIPAPSVATFNSPALALVIPDGIDCGASAPAVCDAGINHTIPVALPGGSVISNMKVKLNVNHTWIGDLIVVLKAPNNQVFNLLYHRNGTGATQGGTNLTNTVISSTATTAISSGSAPYTGEFRPDAAFTSTPGATPDLSGGPTAFVPTVSTFGGLYSTPSGNWTIAICDPYNWRGDCGTLTSWSLEFTYGAPYAGTWAGPAMYLDAAATIPYTGTPATASTIFVKPTATSTYNVSFNTPAPSSCASATANITVNVVNPVVVATQPANAAVCHNGNTSFSVGTTGGPVTYQWQVSTDNALTWSNITNGGVYSGATTATLNLTGATNAAPNMNGYRYRCNVTAAPCAGTVPTNGAATLTVNALPAVTLTATDLQLTPGNPTGQFSTITASSIPAATSYAWQYNGATLTSGTPAVPVTGASYIAGIDGLGTYTVRSTTAAGCTSTAALAGSIAIGAEASERLWIYPNPTNGAFQVRLYYPGGTVAERRAVNVYNAVGQVVASKEFNLLNNTPQYLRMDFDLSNLGAGTYVVKVVDKNTGKITSGLVVVL